MDRAALLEPVRARLRRVRPGRRWLPGAGALLVLLLVVALGGFRPAPAAGVRDFAVGEEIVLRRWVLVVEQAEIIDRTDYDSPAPPTVRVRLRATWTEDASTYGLGTGLVQVVVPGGPDAADDPSTRSVDGYSGGFDPDVARPVALEFTWPDGATETTPRLPAPATVDVVVSDERPAQNFLFANSWVTTRPLGHVTVPLLDRRQR